MKNERNWTQRVRIHLINLLVKVSSCARKRGRVVKREGAVFTTFVYMRPCITEMQQAVSSCKVVV